MKASGEQRPDLLAYRMNKLFIHDDKIGPFAKFWIEPFSHIEPSQLPSTTQEQAVEVELGLRPELLEYIGSNVPRLEPYRDAFPYDSAPETQSTDKKATIFAIPEMLVVPTSNKLRLSFDDVMKVVNTLDAPIRSMVDVTPKSLGTGLVEWPIWDVKLGFVDQVRKDWAANIAADVPAKLEVLCFGLPRKVWRLVVCSLTGSVATGRFEIV